MHSVSFNRSAHLLPRGPTLVSKPSHQLPGSYTALPPSVLGAYVQGDELATLNHLACAKRGVH